MSVARLWRSVRRAGLIAGTALLFLGVLLPNVASAAPAKPAIERPAYQTYYTVRRGDTLSGIAAMYGTTVRAIMAANGLASTRIYAGQVLYIPTGGGGGGGGGGGASCSQYHYVRPGDTLFGIAQWYGVSASSIAQANGIYNWSRIYVGQCLCIPGGYYPPEPVPPQPWPPKPNPPQPWPPQPGPVCSQYYTVQRGDTLSGIARMCGTTTQQLAYLNGLRNPSFIYVGQVLRTY